MPTRRVPRPSGTPPPRRKGPTRRRERPDSDSEMRITSSTPPPIWKKPAFIFGAGGGGLFLLILIIVLASGGETPAPDKKPRERSSAKRRKAYTPDVSLYLAEGKDKCQRGEALVKPRLHPNAGAPREPIRLDLEKGITLLNEGLAAYKTAADRSGKSYKTETESYERTRAIGIKVLCDDDLEKEGMAMCERGLKQIQSTEALMIGKQTLSDDEQASLKKSLEEGINLIRSGMGFLDRSYIVSKHTFDVKRFAKAQKAARMKFLELKGD